MSGDGEGVALRSTDGAAVGGVAEGNANGAPSGGPTPRPDAHDCMRPSTPNAETETRERYTRSTDGGDGTCEGTRAQTDLDRRSPSTLNAEALTDAEPLGRCCYGGMKPKSACASCAGWDARASAEPVALSHVATTVGTTTPGFRVTLDLVPGASLPAGTKLYTTLRMPAPPPSGDAQDADTDEVARKSGWHQREDGYWIQAWVIAARGEGADR